jgi:hypothetical protein
MRINSGTAIAGCVSLSWIATLSGNCCQSVLLRRNRRMRSANEHATRKILLHKAQRLAHARRIVGIEGSRQGFRRQSSRQRSDKIAAAELLEIEVVRGGSSPQAQVLMVLPP